MGKIQYPNGKPCQCGCGQPTKRNISGGLNKGYNKYAEGHQPPRALCNPETRAKAAAVRYASIPLGTRRIHKVHNKEYWVIKVAGGGRWPLEHRHIMATRLGRRLRTNEHVHHRDNNGLNNGLHADGKDNLMLMSASKHIKLTHQETPPNTPYCTCPCCGQTHFKKNKPTD